jgi:hypothetical protein
MPVREPVSVPAAPALERLAATLAAPVQVAAPVPGPVAAAQAPAPVPAPATAVAKEVTWPCPRCKASVAISLDACPECGAGFLSGVAQKTSTKLPIIGDVGRMSQGQRLLIGAGISIVLMMAFVVILEVGGHLL